MWSYNLQSFICWTLLDIYFVLTDQTIHAETIDVTMPRSFLRTLFAILFHIYTAGIISLSLVLVTVTR